jgi:hypothetical protein
MARAFSAKYVWIILSPTGYERLVRDLGILNGLVPSIVEVRIADKHQPSL